MSLTKSDEIIIKDMIKQEIGQIVCNFQKEERKNLHKLCDNGHIKRLLQVSEAIKESGVSVTTLTGLLGMSVLGSDIGKKLIGFLLLGIMVAGILGLVYLFGTHSTAAHVIVK